MSSIFFSTLLWAAALSSGLMAGVYFAFSVFVMKSFSNMETAQAVIAMNAINVTIVRSWFIPLFLASSVVSVLMIFIALTSWGATDASLVVIAGIVYFVGMFICTVAFNVPLNNSLASLDPYGVQTQKVWSHYLNRWTKWNHVRTVSSLISCSLSIRLLISFG